MPKTMKQISNIITKFNQEWRRRSLQLNLK